jgi:galactarate dehydratase
VPQGHKVALTDLDQGAPIRRYGQVIGYAAKPIRRGSWVEESLVRMPEPPALDALPLATDKAAPQSRLESYTFEGYRNADGSVGTRNILGISTSVPVRGRHARVCHQAYPGRAAAQVPQCRCRCGTYPCLRLRSGDHAPAAVIPIRTLQNLALNPNFGGEVMVVGLGCEKLIPERLLPKHEGSAKPARADVMRLQDESYQGFGQMIGAIMEMAEQRLEKLNRRRRETCPASDLIIGLQCGGSDASPASLPIRR